MARPVAPLRPASGKPVPSAGTRSSFRRQSISRQEVQMKYALLIYSKPGSHEALPEDEYKSTFAEYMAISDDPRTESGAQLQPVETATTVRAQNGQTLTTDGPYADTKEVFAGYFVIDAGNLDEALEVAGRIPAIRLGGAVEVRPVVEH
jgi:hypothetical protein